ncbi:MAG: pyruvate kinase [Alphaproteobacteria bacterium]|nr:pyruvate kinase [Alphaproteobacteria bacterium]
MRRQRNTKILATLGPASSDPARIAELFRAGADVFRLNFSHGEHEDHRARYQAIRQLEKDLQRPIGILMDLQGPKLRVGKFAEGRVTLAAGQRFRFDLSRDPGDDKRVCLPHAEVLSVLKPGVELLLDDGKLRLRVEAAGDGYAETVVTTGGVLSDRKGVNVPGVILPVEPLTDKDRADLRFGLELGVDWVAQSFVQQPEDMAELRKLIAGRAALMVKLEKPAAIDRLQEIVEQSDAVMVARGDLGVELPPEDVPSLQKRIIAACRQAGKPVVVATQMLESMIASPQPTRAEASDVATAVFDGADAVMLSAESASGSHPVEAVTMMDRIVARTEREPSYHRIMDAQHPEPEETAPDAITKAAAQVAHTIHAAAIVTYTTSGSTAFRAARERPEVPILCLTSKLETARRMAVVWGIHAVVTPDIANLAEMVDRACTIARQDNFAKPGSRVVITAGVPFGTPGATNLIRIAWVGG